MPLTHSSTVSILEEIEDTALIQMVYVSKLTLASRLNNTIFDEVKLSAREYNQRNNITGILCYGNGHFLQCIEGKKSQVLALKKRIFSDRRHKDIKILVIKTIDRRTFIDWRMRLLFLERWLWSSTTKKQVTQLSPFLPFRPHSWTTEGIERFLQVISTFDTPPHVKTAGITYNASANMFRHVIAPHQAFLVIQSVLALFVIIAIVLLYL